MIRPGVLADYPALVELFAQYPYKVAQRVAQRLDRERLNNFYAAGLRAGLEKHAPYWLAERDGKPIALAGLAADAWHSEVYGMRMGKLQPWLNTISIAAGAEMLAVIEEAALRAGHEHLSVRIDGEDFANLHLFESAGWRLIDVSLKFSRPMPQVSAIPAPPESEFHFVDLAQPGDAQWIRCIGSQTHGGTHFLNDPALPADKTRELFARWLDRCIDRLAYRIYVLRSKRDREGAGVGFVTYLRNQAFARAVGRSPLILDFVLLDPELRGTGLGPLLVEESLMREADSGFDYCELRTSAHNLPAVAAYEKLHFRCCATDFVLHKLLKA